jgi:hypothetical protein
MQVTITYNDDTAFTVEEIVKQATLNYGKHTQVKVMPDSSNPHDLIYFALQAMLTHKQLSLLYDDKFTYQKELQVLRSDTIYKLGEILDQVIIDNESKIA